MKLPEEPKKDRRPQRLFSFFFRAMGLVTFGAFTLLAGFDLGRGNESEAFANGIIALFWLMFTVITHMEAVADAKRQEATEYFDKTIDLLKGLAQLEEQHIAKREAAKAEAKMLEEIAAKEAEEKQHAHDHEMFNALVQDLGLGEKKPNARQIAKLQKAFHDNTDRYVSFENAPDGGYIVRFHAEEPQPVDAAPGRTKAHEAARKRGNAARNAERRSKSQQRRENAVKGNGPVTDDEAKAKSKSEAPLPGQTELPINNDKSEGEKPKEQE